ncbi:hypothetical protein Bca52824_063290 [Brassica carinata]|uniref:Uncharacterized protein n=1 Tax=Brassica carinata TaxID=52824 RepID=A0A8X7QHJ1_BRACI|nr:hypothetical protein Bca52824_063290 [Brassica carinata]
MASQQVVPARPATIQPSLWLGCVATFVVFISIQRMSFEPEVRSSVKRLKRFPTTEEKLSI